MRALIQRAKQALWQQPAFARPVLRRYLQRDQARFADVCERQGFRVDHTLPMPEFIAQLRAQRSGRSTCAIIASGSSLTGQLDALQAQAGRWAFYTCNMGGLSMLPMDLWTLEIAADEPPAVAALSALQAEIVEACAGSQTTLVAKNIWNGRVKPENLARDYRHPLAVLRDVQLPSAGHLFAGPRGRECAFATMFDPHQYFLVQAYTSVISLVQLAFFAGYTDLRIVGLDGSGPHFFHEFAPAGHEALVARLRLAMPAPPAQTLHPAGNPARAMLPHFGRWLAQRGVELTW